MCIRDRHTTPEERFADLFPSSKGTAHEAVGVCPRCGAPVFEGKKGFFLSLIHI